MGGRRGRGSALAAKRSKAAHALQLACVRSDPRSGDWAKEPGRGRKPAAACLQLRTRFLICNAMPTTCPTTRATRKPGYGDTKGLRVFLAEYPDLATGGLLITMTIMITRKDTYKRRRSPARIDPTSILAGSVMPEAKRWCPRDHASNASRPLLSRAVTRLLSASSSRSFS